MHPDSTFIVHDSCTKESIFTNNYLIIYDNSRAKEENNQNRLNFASLDSYVYEPEELKCSGEGRRIIPKQQAVPKDLGDQSSPMYLSGYPLPIPVWACSTGSMHLHLLLEKIAWFNCKLFKTNQQSKMAQNSTRLHIYSERRWTWTGVT